MFLKSYFATLLICIVVLAGPAQVPTYSHLTSSGDVTEAKGKPEWTFPAWFVARRECRKLFPSATMAIYELQPPTVKFYEGGLISGRYLGVYDFVQNQVLISMEGGDSEVFSSMVHEMIHYIAHKAGGLSRPQRDALHAWVEEDYKAGAY